MLFVLRFKRFKFEWWLGMMQKIKDSTIGSNFVLNFQAAGQQNQDGSSNTTPNGDSEMREDN